MTHHQMTTRLLLIFVCLLLLGSLLYYYISAGIIQVPLLGGTQGSTPVAQAPVASTSLAASSSENSAHSGVAAPTVSNTSPATPSKPTAPDQPVSGLVSITNADNNSTVTLTNEQEFAIDLGGGLNWSVQFDPSSSVEQVSASTTDATQGIYKAVAPGTITLKGTGAPVCAPRQPCPMFLAVFTTTLNVQ